MEDKERLRLGRNPDWMSGLPEELLDAPLWNLAIPGKTRKNSEPSGEMSHLRNIKISWLTLKHFIVHFSGECLRLLTLMKRSRKLPLVAVSIR